jgi:hypothetical protein
MKVAVMQPYFFPYIGYFQLINAVDTFVIYDDVNYIKKGWINRNNILVNGTKNLFTIPLKEASQNKLIKEICISEFPKWRDKFIKTIEMNYRKSPQFGEVHEIITNSLKYNGNTIAELNLFTIKAIANYLDIKTEFIDSSSKYNNKFLKGPDRILDICLRENAGIYINPIGGAELYGKENFTANNVNLSFIKTGTIDYKQFNNKFVPGLSIIDILMFNSKASIAKMLSQYSLTTNE